MKLIIVHALLLFLIGCNLESIKVSENRDISGLSFPLDGIGQAPSNSSKIDTIYLEVGQDANLPDSVPALGEDGQPTGAFAYRTGTYNNRVLGIYSVQYAVPGNEEAYQKQVYVVVYAEGDETYDADGDGILDHEDIDDDNDGVPDTEDDLPKDPTEFVDTDGDGVGDNKDAFPFDPTRSEDTDRDGIEDERDNDDDNDGVPDSFDAFPKDGQESQDTDDDGIGNNRDLDDDNDGVLDQWDAFPNDSTEVVDTDGDGVGNNADTDDDDDGTPDDTDVFPLDPSKQHAVGYSFSAEVGNYTSISGTRVNTLENDDVTTVIPLGMTFQFAGSNYTSILASSNGWVAFDPLSSDSRRSNDLSTSEKVLAPLWDDLAAGHSTSSAVYGVSGIAPNRVFTLEWQNWSWYYFCNCNAVSFQLKLYESTNVVEFVYQQGVTNISMGRSASIGLGISSGQYLSLDGTGTSPNASHSTEVNTLQVLPTTGQIYRFTPE
jgi:hypothetical protein